MKSRLTLRKIAFCVIIIVGSFDCYGQFNDVIVLQLVKTALHERKLPSQLINNKDSIDYHINVVVLQKTKENRLSSDVFLKHDDIEYRIWTLEDLFLRNPHWMTPLNIQRTRNRISFDFTTSHLSKYPEVCYKGTISGKLTDGEWNLRKCSYDVIPCQFDLKKLSE